MPEALSQSPADPAAFPLSFFDSFEEMVNLSGRPPKSRPYLLGYMPRNPIAFVPQDVWMTTQVAEERYCPDKRLPCEA